MAVEKSALRVTELDFDSIKNNLKQYLRNQTEFQDFDFEGSGMSVLLDVLAYNTHYMSFYLNMVGNEMFLDTAQLRASILSHAKAINYIPRSKKGATAMIDVTVTPTGNEDKTSQTLTLEKYTKFLGSDIDGVNHQFVTTYANTSSKTGNSFVFSNVAIRQGEVVTIQFEMTAANETRRFNIPSENIDVDSLMITVQESASNPTFMPYVLADDITDLNSESQVYFIEENENSTYTLYFGDDILGRRPKNGNIINCTYLDTMGAETNNVTNFVHVDAIGGYSGNVIVSTGKASFDGMDKETIEEVRFRAPYAYSTQNRAVTKNDYENLILRKFPTVQALSVWGGDENIPVVYGKVYISIKEKEGYYLSNADKESIKNEIQSRNVMSVIPEIVDPDYSYIVSLGKVYYKPAMTPYTNDQLVNLIKAAISDYNDRELSDFDSVFRKSKLQYYIENADPSITGSDVDVYMQKRVELVLNKLSNYTLNFNSVLRKGDFNQKISSYPEITVLDIDNIQRDVLFEEVPESFTGVESIHIINPGINYTEVPTVTITGDGTGATATAKIVNGKISSITVTNRGSNYTTATVSITGGGGSEAYAQANIENNSGTLRTYYYRTNGEKVIVNSQAGTIDYQNGIINIRGLYPLAVKENDFYGENILTLRVPLEEENIYPLRNRIVVIDEEDASSRQIELIPEK